MNLANAWLLGADHHHGQDPGLGRGHGSQDHLDHDHAPADNNLRSAYVHVLAGALNSVLAIATLPAGRYLGWAWMNAAIGIVGALVIARWSWTLLRYTAAVLVGADAGKERYSDVRDALEDGDTAVGDLHIWRIGPGKNPVIASVIAADLHRPSNMQRVWRCTPNMPM